MFYKQKSESELKEGKRAIELLGGRIVDVFEYTLHSAPESERVIIIIKKEKNTPEKYPREYKKIIKVPL